MIELSYNLMILFLSNYMIVYYPIASAYRISDRSLILVLGNRKNTFGRSMALCCAMNMPVMLWGSKYGRNIISIFVTLKMKIHLKDVECVSEGVTECFIHVWGTGDLRMWC